MDWDLCHASEFTIIVVVVVVVIVVGCFCFCFVVVCCCLVVQAQFVDPQDVNDILFPPEIDPAQLSEFGSAQSILPASFLIDRGARGTTT